MAANTSGSTGVPSISAKPCRAKNCFSKVSTNSRRSPSSRAPVDERVDDRVPDPAPDHPRVHRHRADLAEVLPEHVQGAAADHLPVELGDQELRHRLVQRDDFLGQQHPPGVGVHQLLDRRHVGGPGPPHAD